MPETLTTLAARADANLAPPERVTLVAMMETFLATHDGPETFTPAERAHLAAIDAEPFDPGDPGDVAALFARRG